MGLAMAEAGGQPEEASAVDEFTDIIKSRSGRTNNLQMLHLCWICASKTKAKRIFSIA